MKRKNNSSKKKNLFKKWISRLHLWFGLVIGAIIFIVSITGALFVFKDEIQNQLRKNEIYHHEKDIARKETLPIKILEKRIADYTKEKHPLHWVDIPVNKEKSYVFYYYEHNPKAWNYFDEYPVYKSVFINPFSGKILAVHDEKMNFFSIIKSIHWSLLFKTEWGTYIVGIPVLIFVFMLISGIILWWPKNKKALRQRISFRWNNIKSWRRKNYDLHSILGFYASGFAMVFTISGLFYAFMFMKMILYFLFSGGETQYPDFSKYKTQDPAELRTTTTLDKIAAQVEQHYPDADRYSIDLGHPHLDDHVHNNFSVYIYHKEGTYYKNSQIIFDENSGKLLLNRPYSEKNFGEKYIAANYDIHVGAILGIVGKIIAFVVSLICASLPITGFLIWWGRRNKKNKNPESKT